MIEPPKRVTSSEEYAAAQKHKTQTVTVTIETDKKETKPKKQAICGKAGCDKMSAFDWIDRCQDHIKIWA